MSNKNIYLKKIELEFLNIFPKKNQFPIIIINYYSSLLQYILKPFVFCILMQIYSSLLPNVGNKKKHNTFFIAARVAIYITYLSHYVCNIRMNICDRKRWIQSMTQKEINPKWMAPHFFQKTHAFQQPVLPYALPLAIRSLMLAVNRVIYVYCKLNLSANELCSFPIGLTHTRMPNLRAYMHIYMFIHTHAYVFCKIIQPWFSNNFYQTHPPSVCHPYYFSWANKIFCPTFCSLMSAYLINIYAYVYVYISSICMFL